MTRVQWEWRFVDAGEAALEQPQSPAFTTRFDAEAWLGEHWRHLATQGVVAAQLLQQGAPAAPVLPLRTG